MAEGVIIEANLDKKKALLPLLLLKMARLKPEWLLLPELHSPLSELLKTFWASKLKKQHSQVRFELSAGMNCLPPVTLHCFQK
jgi:hypothetical protein